MMDPLFGWKCVVILEHAEDLGAHWGGKNAALFPGKLGHRGSFANWDPNILIDIFRQIALRQGVSWHEENASWQPQKEAQIKKTRVRVIKRNISEYKLLLNRDCPRFLIAILGRLLMNTRTNSGKLRSTNCNFFWIYLSQNMFWAQQSYNSYLHCFPCEEN